MNTEQQLTKDEIVDKVKKLLNFMNQWLLISLGKGEVK